jgi:hypothetical protein
VSRRLAASATEVAQSRPCRPCWRMRPLVSPIDEEEPRSGELSTAGQNAYALARQKNAPVPRREPSRVVPTPGWGFLRSASRTAAPSVQGATGRLDAGTSPSLASYHAPHCRKLIRRSGPSLLTLLRQPLGDLARGMSPLSLLDKCRPLITGPCRQLNSRTTSWPR